MLTNGTFIIREEKTVDDQQTEGRLAINILTVLLLRIFIVSFFTLKFKIPRYLYCCCAYFKNTINDVQPLLLSRPLFHYYICILLTRDKSQDTNNYEFSLTIKNIFKI